MSYKIGNAEQHSQWHDTPISTGQAIPEVDRSNDPFIRSRQKHDLKFLDVLLVPRIKEHMRQGGQFKDREDLVESLAPGAAGNVRNAFSSLSQALGFSMNKDEANDIKRRYASEFLLIEKAFALRMNGKSDEEILEALKKEIADSLLQTV